jgi:amidase
MARSVSSLELWLKAQLQNRPWDFDQSAIFMPWKQEQAFRTTAKLRIGVLWDDGVVKPTPPITVRGSNIHR